MTRTKRTALNLVSNYAGSLSSMTVLLFLTPVIIKSLGTDEFGLWVLAFSVMGIFGLLDLGLLTSTVKFVAECKGSGDWKRRNEILSTLFCFYVAIAVVAAAGVLALSLNFSALFNISEALERKASMLVLILGLRTVVLGLPLGFFRAVLFGHQSIVLINISRTTSTFLYGAGCWYVLSTGQGILALAWVNLATMLLEHIVYVVWTFRSLPDIRIGPALASRKIWREIASFSGSQIIVNTASLIRLRTDPLIVTMFFPLSFVAIYSVGLKVAEQINFLVKQGTNVLAPVVAELHAGGEGEKIAPILVKVMKFAIAPAVAFAVSVYFLGEGALVSWLGIEFAGAAPILAILVTSSVFAVVELTTSGFLAMTGHHVATSRAAVASGVVNVVASLVLVQFLGLLGVALGTLVAGVTVDALLVPGLACRVYKMSPARLARDTVVPLALPVLVQCVVLWMLVANFGTGTLFHVLGIGVLGLASFAGAFWLFAVSAGEKLALRTRMPSFRRPHRLRNQIAS